MSSLKRRLDRLGTSLQPTERTMEAGGHLPAEHEAIRSALDRVALLGHRQRVAVDDLSLESDEDREAWAIFDAGRKRAQRGEGL